MVLNRIIGLFTVVIGQKFKKKTKSVKNEIELKYPQKLSLFQRMSLKFDRSNFLKSCLNYFFYEYMVQLEVICDEKFSTKIIIHK